jgi:type II secretion system protein C
MVLKGLYGKDARGYVIVALKSSPDTTTIVAVGEDFSGYILKSILMESVIFTQAGKEYILSLEESTHTSSITKVKKTASLSLEASKDVSRQDIAYYAKDPKQIWKDISIVEVKEGDTIKGFKVTNIQPNSKFALLGLEKGDIIIKANNIELKSYRDALEIYKKINKLDTVQIVLMRNNQEKELVYEIN